MHKLIIAAGLVALASPAFAADYYIIQNPTTKVCTITEERPASSGGIVVGTPFGARVEAESHMKIVKECTEGTTGSGGKVIEEKREQRVR
jgi:hypothetical protein